MQDVLEIEKWLSNYLSLGFESAWLVAVFSIVFLTLACAFFARIFFNRLALQLKRTNNHWDDILLEAIRRPIIFMIWLLGGCLAIFATNALMVLWS